MSEHKEQPSAEKPRESLAAKEQKDIWDAVLTPEEKKELFMAEEEIASPPALTSPDDAAERDRVILRKKQLQADPRITHRHAMEHSIADQLKKGDTDAAKANARLFLSVLRTYRQQKKEHRAACEALLQKSLTQTKALLDVPDASLAELQTAIQSGPPRLPLNAPQELDDTFQAVRLEWQSVFTGVAGMLGKDVSSPAISALRQRYAEYSENVRAYEAACKAFGTERFKKNIGFPSDMSDAEIQEFLRDIAAPLPRPEEAKRKGDRTEKGIISTYRELERARAEMAQKLPVILRYGSKDALREKLVTYLLKRDMYEQRIAERPSASATWALYLGVTANELAEEALEGTLGFPDKLFGVGAKELQSFAPDTRLKIVQGWKALTTKLSAKGIPVEALGDVLKTLNKSPLGPAFWGELMSIESPVTVLLWAYYMHTSDDKFKACVQFGSFIAMSGVSNKIVSSVLTRMGIGLKVPGVPVVKFVAALLLAFVASDKIDQFSTWADTKLWPDSQEKHDAFVKLGFWTAEGTFGQGYEAIESTGLMTINPDTDMDSFFKREGVLPDYENNTIDRSYYQTTESWNSRVDLAIAAEKNPVKKKLWELEKISDPIEWGERMSVRLYAQVAALKKMEEQLAQGFWEKGLIKTRDELNGLDLATRDTGDARNDRVLGIELGSGSLKNIRLYMEGGAVVSRTIGADNELLPLWNNYKSTLQQVAKSVSIYKHLGLYPPETGRRQWLGDIGAEKLPVTAQVERGLVEEISYRHKRQRAISSSNHTTIEAPEYAAKLVETVPYVEPRSILQWLNLAESDFDEQTEEIEHFKTFVRLNARLFHGRELDRVLEPISKRSLSGQPATYEDLQKVYTLMSDFLLERSLKEVQIKPVPEADLQMLGINPRLTFEQRGVFGSDKTEVMDLIYKDSAFRHSIAGDCVVIRTVNYSGFIRVECLVILGRSTDRSTWRVSEISTLIPRRLERGKYVYGEPQNSIPRSVPYEEWIKAHPDDVRRFKIPMEALEEANRVLEGGSPQEKAAS